MAGSIQDQLVKAGLSDTKKLKAVKKEKRKQPKLAKGTRDHPTDEIKEAARQAALDKANRARELNAANNEAGHRKAINAQIKQLIAVHQEPRDHGDIHFNFTDGNKVKKILVTAPQRGKLIAGLLKIVKQGDRYELVPSPIADKIAQRDADRMIDCRGSNEPELTEDEKDWYKNFEIPDDLDW